ncbi:MAG: ABC transporter permease [Candidatus Brocadiia bacterium]
MLKFRAKRTIRMGLKSLWLHKLRSVLTATGIILGVAAVIVMLAIGEGGSHEALEQIRQLGSQNIIVTSVKPPEEHSVATEQTWALSYGLTYLDAERIHTTVSNVQVMVPSRHIRQHLRHLHRRVDGTIVGVVPWYPDVAKRELLQGRFLTSVDMHAKTTVCVLNEPMVDALFPFSSPLGKTVKGGGQCYRVVGVLRGRSGGSRQGNGSEAATGPHEIYVPMATVQARYGDVIYRRRSGTREVTIVELHRLIAKAATLEDVVPVSRAIRRILDHAHEKQDYAIDVPLERLRAAKESLRIWNFVLSGIAAISLLVGGIGIMNIMLATVTERTREIGIRRALGARRRDIVAQFLTETTLLAAAGGLIGVSLGLGGARVVSFAANRLTLVTPASCVLAFSISVAVGLVFGIYPAYRAASMDPIQALRHE